MQSQVVQMQSITSQVLTHLHLQWTAICKTPAMSFGLIRASGSLLAEQDGHPSLQFSDKDEHVYFWFPLLAGLSELTFDPRPDIRRTALEVVHTLFGAVNISCSCIQKVPSACFNTRDFCLNQFRVKTESSDLALAQERQQIAPFSKYFL